MAFVNNYKPPTIQTVVADPTVPYDVNYCIPLPPYLESERVKLTPLIPSIHGKIFFDAFCTVPELVQYLPITLITYSDFLTFVEDFRADPNAMLFAIIDKTKSNEEADLKAWLAGIIGFVGTAKKNLSLEIAPVMILPAFQRTFITTNAIGIMLKYCLDRPSDNGIGFRRVAWGAHPDNHASIKTAQRMGMKLEAHLRWNWAITPEKIGKKCGEGRGEALGRDSVVLAICWDDWENGAKEQVEKLMQRIQ